MVMQVIKCWELRVSDGRNGHSQKYYVSSKEIAMEWEKNRIYDSIAEKEIVIFDSLTEVTEHENKTLREKALAKLSAEERNALGL
jgi:hypothetical protein